MQVGSFDDIIFETSSKKVMTFADASREISSRYHSHEIIGGKPLIEYVGPGLDLFNLNIKLNGSFGVNPKNEMNKWIILARAGTPSVLVIGDGPVGVDQWVVRTLRAAMTTFVADKLHTADLVITFEEYLEDGWSP